MRFLEIFYEYAVLFAAYLFGICIGIFFFGAPAFVFADSITVSAGGTADVNQCYDDAGAGNLGETHWVGSTDPTYSIYTAGLVGVDTYCRLGLAANENGTQLYYADIGASNVACNASIAASLSYTVDTGGSPAPSMSASSSTCPLPPVPFDTSTSTVDQIHENLFHSILIFFVAMCKVGWLLRRCYAQRHCSTCSQSISPVLVPIRGLYGGGRMGKTRYIRLRATI